MWKMAVTLALGCSIAFAQARQAPQFAFAGGSVSGIVREAGTGSPIERAQVYINFTVGSDQKQIATFTDAQGRYTLRDVPPGVYEVFALSPTRVTEVSGYKRMTGGFKASKQITLYPGRDLTSIDIDISFTSEAATISGRVLDENTDPVPNATVRLVQRYYQFGVLMYSGAGRADTNDRGEYAIRLSEGEGPYSYLVEVKSGPMQLNAYAVPTDPKLRKKVFAPTYFPNSPSIDGAQPLLSRLGEHLEGIDVQILKSVPYCIEGTLEAEGIPAPLEFEFSTEQPANGGISFSSLPTGKANPNGRFCICDVAPGQYRLTALRRSSGLGAPSLLGTTVIGVTDADIRDIRVNAESGGPLYGRVVWEAKESDKPSDSEVRISISSLTGARGSNARSSIPGEFSIPGVFLDDYGVRAAGLPKGVYVKDVTYGGVSVLAEPLRYGGPIGNEGLRVTVARDGGFTQVKVADREGKPLPRTYVYIMPAGVASEASLSTVLVYGQTDRSGVFLSGTLRPGKYNVVASGSEISRSPEGIHALLLAQSRATAVDITSNRTAQVTLQFASTD